MFDEMSKRAHASGIPVNSPVSGSKPTCTTCLNLDGYEMLGFSFSSFGFLLPPPNQKLLFDVVVSISGSFGKGRISTGSETASEPRFEVSLSGGAGGFSSSSEDIFSFLGKLCAAFFSNPSFQKYKFCSFQVFLTYED